ncbi:MAG: FAD binding domain-containing protein [Chloroflexi bacterium]|nr:FAD binding domain-containing protein [Chloroflexota bacterium]
MRDLRDYVRPASPEEAIDIKKRHGERAAYLAGGSDLLVCRPRNLEVAIDIRHCGLGYVRETEEAYVIGGAALLRDAERELAGVAGGMLRNALRNTAPWLIRNAATVAGNIANASPAADCVPALMALDAELILMDGEEERVPVAGVLVGPHQTTLGDRLIREIHLPKTASGRRAVFTKLARSASDIALVNLAVAVEREGEVIREARIALGAVAPVPMRAERAEGLLAGQRPTPELLREVEQIVREEVSPISDWRASEQYRRRMSGVLVRRALEQIMAMGEGT